MEQTWRDVFKITEKEENIFDTDHSEHTEAYIQIHHKRIKAYDTADLTRQNDTISYTIPITTEEVKKHISRLQNKAPGSSRINKILLQNRPNKPITALTNLF